MILRIVLSSILTLSFAGVGVEFVQSGTLEPKAMFSHEQGYSIDARVVVNQDQLAGKWKQFKGELKQKWAEFTEDDLLAIEGRVDKLEGKIQERYGNRREEVKEWVDEWFDTHGTRKEPSES